MAFAGTLVASGRSRGVVVGTGLDTQLGLIAETVFGRQATRPPLLELQPVSLVDWVALSPSRC